MGQLKLRLVGIIIGALGMTASSLMNRGNAQDFTVKISDADLAEVQEIMRRCLGDELPALYVDRHQARRYDDYFDFSVMFGLHQQDAGRKARFVARLHRLETQLSWEPYDIKLIGEDRLDDGRRVGFEGWIEPEAIDEIVAFIERRWNTQIAIGTVAIEHISSSNRPVFQCRYESLEQKPGVHYTVRVANHEFAKGSWAIPKAGQATPVISGSSTQAPFSLRLVRDTAGLLAIDTARCEVPCHPIVLATLRRLIETPDPMPEEEKRRNAALAVLPSDFTGVAFLEERVTFDDQHEIFEAELPDVTTSEGRIVSSYVACSRTIALGSPWACKHEITSIRQTVRGQRFPVRVQGTGLPPLVVQHHVENITNQLRADRTLPRAEIVVLSLTQTLDTLYSTATVGEKLLTLAVDEETGKIRIVRSTAAGE